MDHRKLWTSQQDQLRKLLSAQAHFEDVRQLFFSQHAAVHAAAISEAPAWSLEDEVLEGLGDDSIRACPKPGMNSIAWLLWHTIRIEDLSMNFLVFGQPQILDSGDWSTRLGLLLRDVGCGMDAADVASFSAQVSVPALKEYRAAVGRSTRARVLQLQSAQLKELVSPAAVQQLLALGDIGAKGAWLAEYYTGRTKRFFLTRTATSHNNIHLNEASRMRAFLEKIARGRG